MSNYIYLLQEREFIKTGEPIYKIGKTKQEHNKRFSQYPKGSVLMFQILCENCDTSEKELIKIFKEKYKLRKDIGAEYFEGDSKEMINDIYFHLNKPLQDDTIKNIFPDYLQDENFEGNKRFVLIKGGFKFLYIENKNLVEFNLKDNFADKYQYFYKLVKKKIIQFDIIYDINCSHFINLLNYTKFKFNIESFKQTKKNHPYEIFLNNSLINDKYYAVLAITSPKDNIFKIFHGFNLISNFALEFGGEIYFIIKIGYLYFEFQYFINYLPNKIRFNKAGDYTFTDSNIITENYEEIYLPKNSWENIENLRNYYEKFESVIKKLGKNLTKNKHTKKILNSINMIV